MAAVDVLRHHLEAREQARREGMRTLRQSGLLAIFDGMTSVEEVLREQFNVTSAFAQRRELNDANSQAVVQVFPEPAGACTMKLRSTSSTSARSVPRYASSSAALIARSSLVSPLTRGVISRPASMASTIVWLRSTSNARTPADPAGGR